MYNVNQNYDCPSFDGLYDFCELAVGGSIDAADLLITGCADVAINWSGGFHHAKKTGASGFCYVNDIVLCILELLEQFPKVLYLDIDVHHGDGVEEAFFNTNRVMTVSFHQYEEDFFPGTGSIDEIGDGIGRHYSVNIPLKKGIDDITYFNLFKPVMDLVMGSYRPEAVVMQCGADSLAKDRLGHFNLSLKGHAECVKYMLSFNVPIVFLGGGGYTIENVSRCWAYETGVILGTEIDNDLPKSDEFHHIYSMDNGKLHFGIENKPNENTPEYLHKVLETITENMRYCEARPAVSFHLPSKEFLLDRPEEVEWREIDDEMDSLEEDEPHSLKERRSPSR